MELQIIELIGDYTQSCIVLWGIVYLLGKVIDLFAGIWS